MSLKLARGFATLAVLVLVIAPALLAAYLRLIECFLHLFGG